MERLFFDVVNLSITASWVIAVVLVLRLALRPAPKKYVCLLWLVVLFRLLCPVTVETAFSLVPQHKAIQPEIVYTTPQVESRSEVVNDLADKTVNPVLQQHSAPNPMGSVNPLQVYVFLAARLWALGVAVLCGYTLVSWLRLRRQLGEAVPDEEGIYLCDGISSPFVFGIVRPRIYLPFGLDEDERRWVLLHERSHIVRKDFLLKPLFWLAVVLHWMNPLVWAAWHFYSRDVELACDERAIRSLDDNQKWCYSNTLLQLAVQRTAWSCPVAFGNNSVKQRIRHVLRYKQAAVGVVAVTVAVIVMMMAALGTNPVQREDLSQLADQWAQSWADRDGETRYACMSKALQQQVDQCVDWENMEQWENWMPMWVTGENGQKGMFLRGSSPWVESWQVTLQMPELSPTGKPLEPYLTIITYDMMDSGQEHYVYEEQLQWEQHQDQWQVTGCTVTVDYLSPEVYEAAQQISQTVLNGHDTWRLDPEQVAMAFVHDYLGYEGGHVEAVDMASNTVRYVKTDGAPVEMELYQPVRHVHDPAADFWAVEAYQYREGDKEEQLVHRDVRFDLWASLHIAQ